MTPSSKHDHNDKILSPQRLFHILDRQIKRDSEMTLDELVRIAVLQVCRPGQVGYHLNPYLRTQLVARLRSEIRGTKAEAAEWIASNILECAKSMLPKSASAQAKQQPLNTEKQLNRILNKKSSQERWRKSDVKSIATEIYKTQKKSNQGIRTLRLESQDPLRQVWGFENNAKINLPRQDVRHKMLDTFKGVTNKSGQSLADTLRAASVFRPDVLRSVLGDYWDVGQPVGFVDQKKTILLFRVSNSADAQELMFQQSEIIKRLRSLPGFESIKKVRFEIKS